MGGRLKKILILMVCLGTFLFASYLSVAIDGTNFRTGPGLSHQVKWDLDKHYPLKVISKTGSWYNVKDYQGYNGWIHENTCTKEKSVVINGSIVNLRQGPGMNYSILNKAYRGQMFKILAKKDLWFRVSDYVTGDIYWVHQGFLWGNKV